MKQCTKCKQLKEDEEFSWKSKSLGKRHSQCKECRRQADNERYKNDHVRKNRLKQFIKIKQHILDNMYKMLKNTLNVLYVVILDGMFQIFIM